MGQVFDYTFEWKEKFFSIFTREFLVYNQFPFTSLMKIEEESLEDIGYAFYGFLTPTNE